MEIIYKFLIKIIEKKNFNKNLKKIELKIPEKIKLKICEIN